MKDTSLIKKQEQTPISQRIFLRIKIKNLSSKCTKPQCERYINSVSKIDEDNLFSTRLLLREVNYSRNFHFGKEPSNNSFDKQKKLLNQDLSEFNINKQLVTKTLKTGLTKSELNDAKKDLNYYLPDLRLKNLKLFKNESLSTLLNSEETKNNIEKNNVNNNNENKDINGERVLHLTTEDSKESLSQNGSEADIEKKLKKFNKKVKCEIMLNKERELKLKEIRDNRTRNMFNLRKEAIKDVKKYIDKNGYGYGKYVDKNNNLNLNDINMINNNKYAISSRNQTIEGNPKSNKSSLLNKNCLKLPKINNRNINIEVSNGARTSIRKKSDDKKNSREKEKMYMELKKIKIQEKTNEQSLINKMSHKIKLIYFSKMSKNQKE